MAFDRLPSDYILDRMFDDGAYYKCDDAYWTVEDPETRAHTLAESLQNNSQGDDPVRVSEPKIGLVRDHILSNLMLNVEAYEEVGRGDQCSRVSICVHMKTWGFS